MNKGEFKGKDNYFAIKHTVTKHIVDGIQKCNSIELMVPEYKGGLGYAFIPKAKYTTPNTTETRRQVPNGIQLQRRGIRMFAVWDGGKVAFKSDAVYDTYTVKCLPILTFAAGDLAYLMLLYGREDHASHKCCFSR